MFPVLPYIMYIYITIYRDRLSCSNGCSTTPIKLKGLDYEVACCLLAVDWRAFCSNSIFERNAIELVGSLKKSLSFFFAHLLFIMILLFIMLSLLIEVKLEILLKGIHYTFDLNM